MPTINRSLRTIPKVGRPEKRRLLREELASTFMEKVQSDNDEMSSRNFDSTDKYAKLKRESRKLQEADQELLSRLGGVESKLNIVSTQEHGKIDDIEARMFEETTNQASSLRKLNEIRFQVVEGGLKDVTDHTVTINKRVLNLAEEYVRQNSKDIRRVVLRQNQLEERFQNFGTALPDNLSGEATRESFKPRPNKPIFNEALSSLKLLEELNNFWVAVKPTNTESAFIIGSGLRCTAEDWWDLVKEDIDHYREYCVKFKDRY